MAILLLILIPHLRNDL